MVQKDQRILENKNIVEFKPGQKEEQKGQGNQPPQMPQQEILEKKRLFDPNDDPGDYEYTDDEVYYNYRIGKQLTVEQYEEYKAFWLEQQKEQQGEKQVELNESVNEEIKVVDVKKESLQPASGEPQEEGVYESKYDWSEVSTLKSDEDSVKMTFVKKEIERYKQVQGRAGEGLALQGIIMACNEYCFMKIPIFRSKRGRERLAQVKKWREMAKEELARSRYKTEIEAYHDKAEEVEEYKQEREAEKERERERNQDGKKYIYTEERELFGDTFTTGEKVLGGAVGVLAMLVVNPLKLIAYPFKALGYGVEKLYRKSMEKEYGIKYGDEQKISLKFGKWNIRHYGYSFLDKFKGNFSMMSSEEKYKHAKEMGEDNESYNELLEDTGEMTTDESDEWYLYDKLETERLVYKKNKEQLARLKAMNTTGMTEDELNKYKENVDELETDIELAQDHMKDYIELYKKNNGEDIDSAHYRDILDDIEGYKMSDEFEQVDGEEIKEETKKQDDAIMNGFEADVYEQYAYDKIEKDKKAEYARNNYHRVKAELTALSELDIHEMDEKTLVSHLNKMKALEKTLAQMVDDVKEHIDYKYLSAKDFQKWRHIIYAIDNQPDIEENAIKSVDEYWKLKKQWKKLVNEGGKDQMSKDGRFLGAEINRLELKMNNIQLSLYDFKDYLEGYRQKFDMKKFGPVMEDKVKNKYED